MGILHCSWQFSGRFFFWIEKERGVPEEGAALESLIECFELLTVEKIEAQFFSPLRALESLAGRPLSEETDDGGKRKLDGMYLGVDESLALLTTSLPFFPKGTSFGSSFLFWREASCLVLDLLCRGRFLPGVSRHEGLLSTLWFPVLSDERSQKIYQSLVDATPLVACLPIDGRPVHPDAPDQALRGFLERATDTLVRLFLPRTRPFSESSETSSLNKRILDRWFEALWQKDSGRFAYLEPGLQGLVDRISRWQEGVQPSSVNAQGRVLFRLEALTPEAVRDDQTFSLSFGMLEGDSFFRPWEKNLSDAIQAPLGGDEESYFLRVLAHTAQLFRPLRAVLDEPFPSMVMLTTEQAYEFLKSASTQIEAEGHRVELPSWWAERGKFVGLRLEVLSQDVAMDEAQGVRQSSQSFLASQELLRFSWQVAVGDAVLSLEEFEAISKKGLPFLQIGGRWIELDEDKVKETLSFVKKLNERKQLSLFELLKLGFEDDDVSKRFPVLDIRSQGWVKHLFERDNHPIPACNISSSFKGELRSYQAEGVNWLSFLTALGLGGCLADDMGLGKTVQLLALIATQREDAVKHGVNLGPAILIVPVSIISNWTHEMVRFTPHLRFHVHHGSERLQRKHFEEAAMGVDVVVTTYNLVYRDEVSVSSVPWSLVVLDEAQNIKNPETKQTQAIRRLARRSLELTQEMGYQPSQRFALTGTPLENRLEELWSILEFLNPGILGTLPEFRKSFLAPIERGETKEPIERLAKIVRPFVLRRVKSDPKILPDLPEKIEMDVSVPLTREQAMLYQTVLEEMLPELEQASGMRRRGLVLATITRLKQVCDHPVLFLRDNSSLGGRSQKLERLEQLLEEIFAEGDKVLLFTQFAEMGKLLRPYLEERFSREVLFLHGAVSKNDRDEMVRRFQTREGPSLFLLSLKAGGFGLNLTEANHVIHYDQWWNPAVEDQASDRAHRIGQTRKVQIRRLICQGTLEEKIAELHLRKKKLAQEVLQVQDEALTELSFSELKQLFELKTEQTAAFAESEEAEFDQVMQ